MIQKNWRIFWAKKIKKALQDERRKRAVLLVQRYMKGTLVCINFRKLKIGYIYMPNFIKKKIKVKIREAKVIVAKRTIFQKMIFPKLEVIREIIRKRKASVKPKPKITRVQSKVLQFIKKEFVEYDVLKETFNIVHSDTVNQEPSTTSTTLQAPSKNQPPKRKISKDLIHARPVAVPNMNFYTSPKAS